MLRTLARIAVGLVAVGIGLLGVVALVLPRLVETAEFDRALRGAAERALGSPVEWRSLEVGLLPPRLMLEAPAITNRNAADPESAKLEIAAIDLRLELWPLLRRRIQIDSLLVRGPLLVVTRTESGWVLPIESPPDAEAGQGAMPIADAAAEPKSRANFELGVRRVVIENGRIVLHDRTQTLPTQWQFEDLSLVARGDALDDPIELEVSGRLRSGEQDLGRIELAGRISSGSGAGEPISFDLDLGVADLSVDASGIPVEGTLALRAHRKGEAAIGFQGELALVDGGKVGFSGQRDPAGPIEAKIELDAVDLMRFGPRLLDGSEWTGQASGEVNVATDAANALARFATRLRIPNLRVVRDPIEISGAFELDASAEGEGPIRFDARLASTERGRIGARGHTSRDAVVDVALDFERFDLGVLKPWLPSAEWGVAGRATGVGRVVGPAAEPDLLTLKLDVADARMEASGVRATGPVGLKLDVKDPVSERRHGQIDLDLSATALEAPDRFTKPAGQRAEISTKFSPGESKALRFESLVKLRRVDDIRFHGSMGDSTTITLTTPALDLAEWTETLPALKSAQPTGSLRFDRFRYESAEGVADRFAGRIVLSPLDLLIPDRGRVELRGDLIGENTAIRFQDLIARASGLALGVVGKVDDPLGVARYDVTMRSIGETETNELLTQMTSVRDTLFGALDLDVRLAGPASGAESLLQAVSGQLGFSIGKQRGGRLRGASLLRRVLEQFPTLAAVNRLAEPLRGGRSISDYFRDDFRIIEGDLLIANGVVNARKLRLAYDGYEANLAGSLRLDDLGVDMTGEVLLKSEVVNLLSTAVGSQMTFTEPLRIPLARVTRTLSDPKVSMTAETLAAVPRLLLRTKGVDSLIRKGVGDALGRVRDARKGSAGAASPPPAPVPEAVPDAAGDAETSTEPP